MLNVPWVTPSEPKVKGTEGHCMARFIPPEFDERPTDPEIDLGILGPLVERLRERYGDAPLAGVTALLFQHQLENQIAQLRALRDLGLDLERTWWVDIPYTAHAAVRDAAIQLGVPAGQMIRCDRSCGDIPAYRLLEPYAPYQLRRSLAVHHRLQDEAPANLLVLDDGAYFLEADACFAYDFERVGIVEQTSRGYKKLADNASMRKAAARTHLVDVARSEAKTMLEAPFIGIAASRAIKADLERLHAAGRLRAPLADLSYLLLGYGTIGSQVAASLHTDLGRPSIKILDPDRRCELPHQRWNRDTDEQFDVVIGSSGRTSFTVGDHVFLADRAVLVSTSSGAMEFDMRGLVEHASASGSDDVHVSTDQLDETDLHSDIEVEFPGRRVTIVNAGFPINFRREIVSVPSRFIQFTSAMMVCGAVQAVVSRRLGDQPFDRQQASEIVGLYHEDLGAIWTQCGLPSRAAIEDALGAAGWRDPLSPFSSR